MTKPHAQRIAIATGWELDDVRELLACESFETTQEAIAAINHQDHLDQAFKLAEETGMSFDAAMGYYL